MISCAILFIDYSMIMPIVLLVMTSLTFFFHQTVPHETINEVETGLDLIDGVNASPDLIDAVGKIRKD